MGKIASFLATLLLSVPLAAIGLMAVFGIPQLVPAGAGPDRVQVLREVGQALRWGKSSHDSAATPAYEDAPEFDTRPQSTAMSSAFENSPGHSADQHFEQNHSHRPAQSLEQGSPSSSLMASARQFPDSNPSSTRSMPAMQNGGRPESSQFPSHWEDSPAGNASVPAQRMQAMQAFEHAESAAPAFSAAGTAPTSRTNGPFLSWRQASLRLTELGIKNYHLERGATDGSFLFVCVFTPGDAPQVTHRFEAEAEDPLMAVNQVLQQLDGWMQTRFAQSNFPNRSQKLSSSGTALR
jgi:hypothetical protein